MVSAGLLAAGIVMNVVAVLFLVSAVVLILVVLIQKGKGGGLSSAFAGGMASGILGSKTGDVLTWITIGLVSFFILGALVLNKWWKPTMSSSREQMPAPVTTTDAGYPGGQPAERPMQPEPTPTNPPAEVPAEE
ncbi:MAG: preprotein translocase subunit SecG [Sedimentisphaerales bacterium]|nr:preprotein translocase subunit SecG [Sedimentisphaerales bacterium]